MTTSPVPDKAPKRFIVTKDAIDRGNGLIPFPEAIEYVIDGERITKAEWSDPNIYFALKGEHLIIHKADGSESPILLRDGDLLGTDWRVLY